MSADQSRPESELVQHMRRLRALPGNCAESNALIDMAIGVQLRAESGKPKCTAIHWRCYGTDERALNVLASSLVAAPYCTGAPDRGWVLYSKSFGCWQQRTQPEFAPLPGMKPIRIADGWVWAWPPNTERSGGGQ